MEVTKSFTNQAAKQENNLSTETPSTIVCFSHLRWDFVYQRPQHLLSRFATMYSVYYVEEPVFDAKGEPTVTFTSKSDKLWVVVPHLPEGTSPEDAILLQKQLLDKFLRKRKSQDLLFWYYTPMALKFSGHYKAAFTVYDCMDELSHFKFAPPELTQLEDQLLERADIVFTGGHCLYEYKKDRHKNIFPVPSSIDKKHFEQARTTKEEPEDQKNIQGPKLGFYGVIDERFDIELIGEMAEKRPEWQFVLLGPVVKIDPATLPRNKNIHYLGGKSYEQLPLYVSGWDVALIPFMLNDATRFISPTKTPEYLAAGVPVVSTGIRDVIRPYGEAGIVKIATGADEFIEAAENYIQMDRTNWLPEVDEFLKDNSWSNTFMGMHKNIMATIEANNKN
ncbi:glycosyltransferase family 1 protein [Aridibaculum aurantiacum]|uniref:glycosyltransferase family 1 protein n=1 Tax=Aridibaculum aurantiacum TaxID=2810307 RepID=UPI001A96A5C5|nr:glycosyltransferase family 1 protein [Aridibaculum aurantiacum]